MHPIWLNCTGCLLLCLFLKLIIVKLRWDDQSTYALREESWIYSSWDAHQDAGMVRKVDISTLLIELVFCWTNPCIWCRRASLHTAPLLSLNYRRPITSWPTQKFAWRQKKKILVVLSSHFTIIHFSSGWKGDRPIERKAVISICSLNPFLLVWTSYQTRISLYSHSGNISFLIYICKC